eukprot:TRINITY_DN10921_c0_g2_i1.p1 TRINITY_DN10921_c0_g2~~TRINITY_DN10921_c0_g2_i1.p1  ORF type:complete len:467 (+),score=30.00 TRINITY_DN10921_c0_g2_i1:190-1590(+)
MATPTLIHRVTVIDRFRVTPPSGSVPETHLPLTFFDVLWHPSVTVQRIFFFDLPKPYTKSHFLTTQLPTIKQSLSLALQRFYPLAATLTPAPQTGHNEFHYTDGDSVQLTVAESDSDFHALIADHPKDTAEFHPLVPELGSSDLSSFQLTVFANSGFSIGLTVRHVAADGGSIMQFMKHWASVCRLGAESESMNSPSPIYDRDLIPDPTGLKAIFSDQISMQEKAWKEMALKLEAQEKEHMVRATFVLSRANIVELRQRVAAARIVQVEDGGRRSPLHISSFVLTCAYMWACLTKARGHVGDGTIHFGFAVDCRARMSPPIPAAYFGNCIGFGVCSAGVRGSEIASVKDDEGLVAACEVIGRAIQRLDDDGVLNGADQWFSRFCSIVASGDPLLSVAGSPRLQVYDVDFGFGRPRKVEVISIEESGAMSLAESREDGGRGIEVGLALPKSEMERVTYLFKEGLGIH